ncbi:MAG: hypothetical protein AAF368_17845, partial [Planctomycetota bacterium]
MSSPQSTIEKAEAARACGELWRAKEILLGSARTFGFQAEIHRALSRVLIEMKDTLEAGRHLYASGIPPASAEEEAAIDVYLKRFGGSSPVQLKSSLPAPLRSMPFEGWPESMKEDFLRRGFEPPVKVPQFSGSRDFPLVETLGFAAIALVLFVLGVGAV